MCQFRACISILRIACLLWPSLADVNFDIKVGGYLEDVAPVSPGFIGYSIETYNALKYVRSGDHPRLEFAQALKNIYDLTSGPHEGTVLRIGGDSADSSCWAGVATNCSHCSYNLSNEDLEAYQSFAKVAPNVSFVLGVNLGCGPDAALATAHVAAVSRMGMWDIVSAIEIGNEVDHFPGHYRGDGWSMADYLTEFAAHAAAYRSAGMPSRRLQGAVFCGFLADFDHGLPAFAKQFRDDLASISYHAYSLHGGSKPLLPPVWTSPSNASSTAYHTAALLSPDASHGMALKYDPFVRAAREGDVSLVIGEGNTESGGGWANMSNTFAAALWALDWLPEISKRGAKLQNIHGGPDNTYSAIAFDGDQMVLRPLYYGLIAFAELTANRSRWLESAAVQTSKLEANYNLVAHATKDQYGIVKVLLVSKDLVSNENASASVFVPIALLGLDVGRAAGNIVEGVLTHLRAPSSADPYAKNGITWAGQTFDGSIDGLPLGNRVTEHVNGVVVDQGNTVAFNISLPALSAALLVIGRDQPHSGVIV